MLLGVLGQQQTVFYCPSCGSAWHSAEAVLTEDPRPLHELAPQGVRYPTESGVQQQGAVDISETGWAPVIAELIAAHEETG